VSPLHHLSTLRPEKWRALYRQALAAGCGHVIGLEHERLAAPDELVALALPGLVRLGGLALLVDGTSDPSPECARALSREAASVLRLLDRALAAHGRDHGYRVAAWLEQALAAAQASAGVSRVEVDAMPLSRVVLEVVGAVAAVAMALHRDRLGVPGELADALASILVLYVAGADEVDRLVGRARHLVVPPHARCGWSDPARVLSGGCHRGSRLRSKASHD
jgi:hypothetical protein